MSLVCVAALAGVHVFAGRLSFRDRMPRSRWLSVAGGASVGYVFVHIFPELARAQRTLSKAGGEALAFLEHHAYLVALCGLVLFYGLERMLLAERRPSAAMFRLHIGSFALYSALIGYLLVRGDRGLIELLLFFAAMALHFLVNDSALREKHEKRYRHTGRWALAAAIGLGGAAGVAFDVSAAVLDLLFAFIAGSIVLNVLKEELPEDRQGRFSAFLLGAAGYAALLLAASP